MAEAGRRASPRRTILDGFIVAAAALGRILYGLGDAAIKNWDEGLYCAATQAMRQTGQWLYAVHRGRFDGWYGKPPLINWLHRVSTDALGWSLLSLRLPTALATASTIVLAWALGVRLAGRGAGAIAAALLLLAAPYLTEGRFVLLEPLLAAFTLAAILVYDLGTSQSTRAAAACSVAAGALCAAAILTKQILGLFPVLAILGGEALLRRPGYGRRALIFLVTTLLLSGWWFVLVHQEVGEELSRWFFERHVVGRMEGAVEGHANAPGLYLRRVSAYAPAIVVPAAIAGLLGLLAYGRSRFASVALLLFALGHYLVHAALSKTMLPWYAWPIVPVLSVGLATLLTATFTSDRSRVLRWVVPFAIGVGHAKAMEKDPVLVGLALVAVVYVLDATLLKTRFRSAAPTALVLAALALSMRAMPEPSAPRAGAGPPIQQRELAVLLDSRLAHGPRCQFPDARFFFLGRGPSRCAKAADAIGESRPRQVLAYGRISQCPPPAGYRELERQPRRVLYERMSE